MVAVKVGDLVRIKSEEEYAMDDCHYSRPTMFPYGKLGLVIDVQPLKSEYKEYIDEHLNDNDNERNATYPWDYEHDYGYYDYRSLYSDILIVLVEGQSYWMFEEEIALESTSPAKIE
tara:strand:+ start:207 stop:557 length:351 start_codon:yes stop_codon:yes gene_type:complete